MSAPGQQDPQKAQDLVNQYNAYTQELSSLRAKINDLQREADEHALVIETLQETVKTDPDRKCWRMIDTVLVERTVKDVLPALQETLKNFQEAAKNMTEAYLKKEKERQDFAKTNKIVVKPA